MYIVLVVDDNEMIIDGICNFVNNVCKKFNCVGFSSVNDAVKYIRECKDEIKVGILDILVDEGFDGNVKLIKELVKEYPDVHIVLITGMDISDKHIEVIRDSCDFDILYKPFDLNAIIDILEVFTDERKES